MSAEPTHMNDLRTALDRASAGNAAPMGRALPTLTGLSTESTDVPGDMITPRLVIPKVRIKQEVAGYVESNFLSRTNVDGSILRPSKEQLIEELTGLFHMLEEQSGYIDEPKPRRSNSASNRVHSQGA